MNTKIKIYNTNHSPQKKTPKYVGANLRKSVQDLYAGNHKMLVKEIRKDLNKCRDLPVCLNWKARRVKMLILPKLIHRFKPISIKTLARIFIDLSNIILLKIYVERQRN